MLLTDKFISIIYEQSQQKLAPELDSLCRQKFLDYLAVTVAGSSLLKKQIENYPGLTDSKLSHFVPILGCNMYAGAETAALLNGMSSHIAELDDGERFGMVHPGAPVISALVSLIHIYEISAEQFFKGIFIGYEATIRIARLLQPELKDNGYHATGPCGCIGAAMAVSVALGFSKEQMKAAFSAAVTSASGVLSVIREQSELKPYNVGQASVNGLISGLIAKLGLIGPSCVLEGKQGFLKMITGHEILKEIEGPDIKLIMRAYTKPYAACRHCHAPIEAAISLIQKHNLKSHQISDIKVITHRFAAFKHDHKEIENISSAKMSIPYCVAIALKTKKAGVLEFSDNYFADKEVLRLTGLVNVVIDEALTQLVPNKRVGIVELTLASGKKVACRVDLPLGEPENPMSKEMLIRKSIGLIELQGMGKKEVKVLVDQLLTENNIKEMIEKLVFE